MKHLSIDIETYSTVDTRSAGVYPYVEDDDFEILLFAYAVDFGPVSVVDLKSGETIPEEIIKALADDSVIKHAYNAPFEIACLSKDYPVTPVAWECTMFHGMYLGYPSGLAKIGKALGLAEDKQKMAIGKALINYFCKPCKPTKSNGKRKRNLPHHDAEKWKTFIEYCRRDVETEMEIYKRLIIFPVPDEERHQWFIEQHIHSYGIPVDHDLVDGALQIRQEEETALLKEAKTLTGLDNPNSRNQLKAWIDERLGAPLDDLTKDTVAKLYETTTDAAIKRVLEIRQELAKASIKKYDAFKATRCKDGHMRGAHQIYGANRTGRWAGRFIQPQNLPRNYIPMLGVARELVKLGKSEHIKFIWGSLSDTLSQLIRTVIVPTAGHKLVVADFSAIEARVLAWLAGEQWVMDVFATHGKIYEATAANMFGIPIEHIVKGRLEYAYRQKGKVATLALGYQGGSGALIQMSALDQGLTEDELPDIVSRWRQANPNIVSLWHEVEAAVIKTMQTGEVQRLNGLTIRRECEIVYGQDFLTIELPSGRKLYYVKPILKPGKFGTEQLCYQDAVSKGQKLTETYGGKLTENIVQAIARDCLAHSLKAIAPKYNVIMHVHDEVVIDAEPSVSVDEICEIMSRPIAWAPGLKLTAAGFENDFYMKD